MHKSSRTHMATGPRRYSQPVMTGPPSSSSSSLSSTSPMGVNRRGSENVARQRTVDVLPPPVVQYDDKLTVVEAKGPRKMRGKEAPEGHPTFDAETRNPDGSLRTVHCMPDFNASFDQARKARYIRHRTPPDFEQEMSVEQIFRDTKH